MKLLFALVVVSLVAIGPVAAEEEVSDDQMGLSRTSVFATPEPEAFKYDGSASEIPALDQFEVPVIPHKVHDFEKITADQNRCTYCHVQPEMIGQPVEEGEPTPMPADHYASDPATTDSPAVAGGRWVCTQCHVPQADTPPLVGNTTMQDAKE